MAAHAGDSAANAGDSAANASGSECRTANAGDSAANAGDSVKWQRMQEILARDSARTVAANASSAFAANALDDRHTGVCASCSAYRCMRFMLSS